jgi:hypothetical protein
MRPSWHAPIHRRQAGFAALLVALWLGAAGAEPYSVPLDAISPGASAQFDMALAPAQDSAPTTGQAELVTPDAGLGEAAWSTPSRVRTDGAPLWDNLSATFGLDGAKGPDDLGLSANFGIRAAMQTGLPLLEKWGLGFQAGTAFNYHRNATRFLALELDVHDRHQSFTTLGLFQRTESGFNWALAYDYLSLVNYASADLTQFRGQVSYWLDATNEVGVWGTWRDRGDQVSIGGQTLSLRAIDQANLFVRHIWPTGAVTRGWLGVANEHGRFVLNTRNDAPIRHPFVFGADVFIPLNASWALFGEANFITPNDSGTVTAFFGVAFYPGKGTQRAFSNRFAPMLPLANNPTFAVDVQR